MVRRKIKIERIENSAKRHTTFTKRRQGLEKKASAFFEKYNSEGAIITFSAAGNCYHSAQPDIDRVLERFDVESSSELAGEVGNGNAEGIEEEDEQVTELQKRIGKAMESGRWGEAVDDLGEDEIDEVYAEMERIKHKLAARVKEISAREKESPEGGVKEISTTAKESSEGGFSGAGDTN